jgi:hypothetical protein
LKCDAVKKLLPIKRSQSATAPTGKRESPAGLAKAASFCASWRRTAGTRWDNHSLYSSQEGSLVRKIKALRLFNPGIHRDFSLSYAPFENARKIKMLEASLSQLEQLVSDLVQQNQALVSTNQSLTAELAQAKDENESLQLSLMEQEEKQGATVARIQALVERVSAGPVNA